MKKRFITILGLIFVMMFSMLHTKGSIVYAAPANVGQVYSATNQLPGEHPLFGNTKWETSQTTASTKKVPTREGWLAWDNDYTNIADVVFVVYKYDKVANSSIEKMSNYKLVSAHVNYSDVYRVSKGYSYTYEEEIVKNISTKMDYFQELNGSVNFANISLGAKVSNNISVQTAVSNRVSKTNTFTYATDQEISYTIPGGETGGYFAYERRANFDVFMIQVYEVLYNVTKKKGSGWYQNIYFTYDLSGYKLIEQNIKYSAKEGISEGYSRYRLDKTGVWVYDDIKTEGIVYI